MGRNCSAQPFFLAEVIFSSVCHDFNGDIHCTSLVLKGREGLKDATWWVFGSYLQTKQLDWCLDGCIFCKLPPDPVVPVAFFLFFG